MVPVSPQLKDALDKFEQDFQAANLLKGKFIKALFLFEVVLIGATLRRNYKNWIQILPKPVFPLNPLGPLWTRSSYQVNLSIRQVKISVLLIFPLLFTKVATWPWKNAKTIKATVKRIKNQILKGVSPEKVVRNGYEKTCDYLDILNKRFFIQQRALAFQSKALAHIFQRKMYTMGIQSLSDERLKWPIFNLIWEIPDVRNLGVSQFSQPLLQSKLV